MAAQSYCPAWRGPGGSASLPAGQRIQSQCTHSEGSTVLLLLQEEDIN